MTWHTLEPVEIERRLGTGEAGLSEEEAKRRLQEYGPNELEEAPPPSVLAVLLHQFRSPLIYILLIAAAVTLLLGDYIDSAVIAAVLILNAAIGFTQEWKAEASARALMQMVAPRAHVIRDGQDWEIESREVVPGDLVLLESGVRVPADLRLIAAAHLAIDESPLTGESVPVTKRLAPLDLETPLADRVNMAYAGTIVTSGRGRGYVVATGKQTELGKIAEHVRTEKQPQTPLQQRMNQFAKVVGIVVAISAVIAFAIGVALGESPADMFMVAVAMAVAAVPEGLPVVFTITLAVGVFRMARRNAIIRRLPAVETLGSTTVIGSDKTGTLTENRMTVQRIWTAGKRVAIEEGGSHSSEALPSGGQQSGARLAAFEHGRLDGGTDASETRSPWDPLALTLLAGVLTNEAQIYPTDDGYHTRGDPTEAALLIAAARMGIDPARARAAHSVVAEIPFEPDLQYSASIRQWDGGQWVFVKGAPERVLSMCATVATEEGEESLDPAVVAAAARDLAEEGLRVLAMACGRLKEPLKDSEDPPEPANLTFLGLQGMMDPPRAGVREAIDGCKEAGIRVAMITGDHAQTARAIGRQLGIGAPDPVVMTGAQLEKMDDDALRKCVTDVSIYARVTPEHKLRVVRALRSRGEVVAVTGDGVNDAPALKAADIGVAMGKSGTDVAREASDMILADDNFVSIYAAVEEGRVTFDNLRKVTFFLISTGAAAIVAILATQLLRWPLPFLPAQLLWLNLVTNGLQDVALAFEPAEPGVRKRPPRNPREGIISPLLWERTVLAGIVIAVGTLALFRWELDQTGSLARAQTVALTTMVLFQNFQVGNARSEYESIFRISPFSNRFLLLAVAGALFVHIGALYLPATQFVLRVEPIEWQAWVRMVLTALTICVAMEIHKLLRRGARPDLRPAGAPPPAERRFGRRRAPARGPRG